MKETYTPVVVEPDPEANITHLLEDRVAKTPNDALFALPTADGGWSDVTAAEFHRQVIALAKGFIAAGVKPGDKIGFMCKVRYEWTLVDFAAAYAGAIIVPVYETSAPSQLSYILTDSARPRSSSRRLSTSPASTRSAATRRRSKTVWQMHLGDLEKLAAPGTRCRMPTSRRRAPPPKAKTSRR